MFSQLRQRTPLTSSTDPASRTRTQRHIKVRDFWEIELEEVSSSLFGSLHDDVPLSNDESPSESQTESTTVTASSSSSAIAATDPVDEAFLDYLEEIMEKDTDEVLRLKLEPHHMSKPPLNNSIAATGESSSSILPPRRCSLPRNPRKGKNPNKNVAGPTLPLKPIARKRTHRRSHSCDDALLLHLPRVYSALGVC